MAKTKKKQPSVQEPDGIYLLKLVIYLLLGSIWLRASFGSGNSVEIGLPVGFIVGVILTLHERFRLDRKIEYAILVIAMFVGYFLPYGLCVSF